ncbi:MAG: hypothetical protein EBV27_04390, partial [Actinobacteria bacterium]|nr:hypothetical protein [Actinomycetota bacterium]
YHYPRSQETIHECQIGYNKFIEKYEEVVENTKSYYIIANDSLTSYEKFKRTFNAIDVVSHETILPVILNKSKIQGDIVQTNEKVLNPWKAREMFMRELGSCIVSSVSTVYDKIYDCTYGQLIPEKNFVYEICVVGVVKLKVACESFGITVMDGPYFSIYPYNQSNNLYTLTHVTLTPVYKTSCVQDVKITQEDGRKIVALMEETARSFILNYDELFEYVSFFTSVKTKIPNETDDRSMKCLHHDGSRITTFMGGKITGIFGITV